MQLATEPDSVEQQRGPAGWWIWLPWGAILVALVAIVYWPTLGNDFVLIDRYDVKNNSALRSLRGLWNNWFKLGTFEGYYPLTYSTFWLEYQLSGLDPKVCHIVNLLLHATTVLVAWRLLVRLAVPGAWLAAAIYAVHPVEVASVAFMIERKNLLSCALALGSMLAYLRFAPPEPPESGAPSSSRSRWGYYVLALGLYTAALFAKTVAVSVPAVLLVLYWWKRGRLTGATWRKACPISPLAWPCAASR
jgi:hypothetical protein